MIVEYTLKPQGAGESASKNVLVSALCGGVIAADLTDNDPLAVVIGTLGGAYIGEQDPQTAEALGFLARLIIR